MGPLDAVLADLRALAVPSVFNVYFAAASIPLGFLFAIGVALARASGGHFLKRLAAGFTYAFRGSPLAARIAGCGGRVVFVGDAAEDAVGLGDTRVLNRPFSSGAVLDHLASSRRAAWEP